MAASARVLSVASSVLGALLLGGVLAGCTPSAPKPTHSPTASRTPMFASDEEALKAATDAYAAYLKMSDTIAHDGGKNPERIKPYVTAAALDTALKSARQYREASAHSTGWTKFSNAKIAQIIDQGERVSVQFYVCGDVSAVDVIDASGRSLVSKGRPDKTPFQVQAKSGPNDHLIVANTAVWPGGDICG